MHAGLIGGTLAGAVGGGLGDIPFLSNPLAAAESIAAAHTVDQASSVSSALAQSYSQGIFNSAYLKCLAKVTSDIWCCLHASCCSSRREQLGESVFLIRS